MTCEHVVHFLMEPCRGSRLEIPALFQFVGMKAQACLNMCDFCQMTPTVSEFVFHDIRCRPVMCRDIQLVIALAVCCLLQSSTPRR